MVRAALYSFIALICLTYYHIGHSQLYATMKPEDLVSIYDKDIRIKTIDRLISQNITHANFNLGELNKLFELRSITCPGALKSCLNINGWIKSFCNNNIHQASQALPLIWDSLLPNMKDEDIDPMLEQLRNCHPQLRPAKAATYFYLSDLNNKETSPQLKEKALKLLKTEAPVNAVDERLKLLDQKNLLLLEIRIV